VLGIVVAWGAAKCKVTRERSPRDHCTHFAEWRVARCEKIETAAGPRDSARCRSATLMQTALKVVA